MQGWNWKQALQPKSNFMKHEEDYSWTSSRFWNSQGEAVRQVPTQDKCLPRSGIWAGEAHMRPTMAAPCDRLCIRGSATGGNGKRRGKPGLTRRGFALRPIHFFFLPKLFPNSLECTHSSSRNTSSDFPCIYKFGLIAELLADRDVLTGALHSTGRDIPVSWERQSSV